MAGKIMLTRIDNRLIHGQVGVTWTTALGVNLIIVVDELTVQDRLQQALMESIAKSSGAKIKFLGLEEAVKEIPLTGNDQRIFIVVRDPSMVVKLMKRGIPIEEVNVGNIHYSRGKKPLSRKVYVDQNDLSALIEIEESGAYLYIQDVPGTLSKKLVNLRNVKLEERG